MKVQLKAALLDTNIVIGLFKGIPDFTNVFHDYSVIHLPIPVMGELYHGAENSPSNRIVGNLERLEQFAATVGILDCDRHTAKQYGSLKAAQYKRGLPIPENDLWIAALALQHDLVLITRDKHFKSVLGLHLQFMD